MVITKEQLDKRVSRWGGVKQESRNRANAVLRGALDKDVGEKYAGISSKELEEKRKDLKDALPMASDDKVDELVDDLKRDL